MNAFIATLLAASVGFYQPNREPPAKPDSNAPIKVIVRFSVEVLDPKDPKDSFIEVRLKNDGKEKARVPTLYTSGFDRDIILKGGGHSWGLWLTGWGPEKKHTMVDLQPGKEVVIFKLPLGELLLPSTTTKSGRWTWEA
jgi:hypothetical protein